MPVSLQFLLDIPYLAQCIEFEFLLKRCDDRRTSQLCLIRFQSRRWLNKPHGDMIREYGISNPPQSKPQAPQREWLFAESPHSPGHQLPSPALSLVLSLLVDRSAQASGTTNDGRHHPYYIAQPPAALQSRMRRVLESSI